MKPNIRELIRREKATQADLLRYYGEAIGQVERELQVVLHDIDTLRAQGLSPTRGMLERRQAYQRWLELTRQALAGYAVTAGQAITELQRGHIGQALTDSRTLTIRGLGAGPPATVAAVTAEFKVPPPQVIATLVGNAADGTPLADLLADAAGDAFEQARSALVTGVIRGQNPRVIASNLSAAGNIARNRSLLIARTESIGAYRTTSLQSYKANSHLLEGWVWTATLDRRTCPVCWAMHGTLHTLDETLDSHPGCRCTPVPRTRSWADLGIDLPDRRPPIQTGSLVFADLSAADQLAILGRGKFDAYTTGQLTLPDLVQPTHHHRWGPGKRERSLTEALAHV